MDQSPCKACVGAWPADSYRITSLDLTDAYLNEDQFFPGWSVVVLKRHATELFELSREERGQLVEELSTVARAVSVALSAKKINYALLGNQLPHIHWHIIPRLVDDPAPSEAPWAVPHTPRSPSPDERRQRIAVIQRQLG